MPDLVHPCIVLLLVLIEVGLWQWRTILTGRGRMLLPVGLGVVGAVLQITAIAQVVGAAHDPLTIGAYAVGVGGGVLVGVLAGARSRTGRAAATPPRFADRDRHEPATGGKERL